MDPIDNPVLDNYEHMQRMVNQTMKNVNMLAYWHFNSMIKWSQAFNGLFQPAKR